MLLACSPDAETNSHNGLWLGDAAELLGREFYIDWWEGAVPILNQISLAYQT